jgi:predicted permease
MLLRLTLRALLRSPWFAAACIGTVTLSIALASTVFAVVDGVLFDRLPYERPDRLALLFRNIDDPARLEQLRRGTGRAGSTFSATELLNWREANAGFQISAFLINFGIGPVAGAGMAQETTWAARVDSMFFTVLGVQPMMGGFRDEHYRQPYQSGKLRAHPAVISHRLWRRIRPDGEDRLPRDLLRVGDGTLQVVGVLPPDFAFPTNFARTTPDVLLPLDVTADQTGLQGIVRLSDDGGLAGAAEQLRGAVLDPVDHALGNRERSTFRLAFGAVLVVVFLAGLNVAVLLSARGRHRASELAVRTALGASPRKLLQLLLAEALLIALAGATFGGLAARPMLDVAMTAMPTGYLLIKTPQIDVRVLVFAVLAATSTLLVFAAWPAVRTVRSATFGHLRSEHGSTPVSRAWRRIALVGQSAAGILVVIAGTLLVAGFAALWREDVGLERQGTAVVDVTARAVAGEAERAKLLEAAEETAARVPGVERVSSLSGPFLRNAIAGSSFVAPVGALEVVAQDVPVGAGFFETAGLRLLAGRFPTAEEIVSGRPVAVVSRSLARAYWPGRDPLGQPMSSKSGVPIVVVGVVDEIRVVGLEEFRQTAEIYVPMRRASARADRVLILRAAGDPGEVAERVATAILQQWPELFITRAESIDSALAGTVRTRQFQSRLFGAFAVATLVLLGVGIFGAIAMHTAARNREIGVRMALGATASSVRRMILVENLGPVLIGLSVGGLCAWWTTTLLASVIYGVEPHDLRLWALAGFFVSATALVAAWLPAVKASRIDPQVVLRIH